MKSRIVLLCLVASSCGGDRGTQSSSLEYVADQTCITCHELEANDWTSSHHDLAMQLPSDTTVLGDFADVQFEHFGVRSRFYRQGEEFRVETEGAKGEVEDFRVAYVFGVEPLQQYLVEFPGGAMQCLTVAWDTEEQRWFHLYPDEKIGHADPLHWTGIYQRWNSMCADCHSTDLQKGFDPQSKQYETTWKELDVGCQACHGPGSGHLAWLEKSDKTDDPSMGLMRSLSRDDPAGQLETCAPCHSRRTPIAPDDLSGSFLDRYVPQTLLPGLYHADGQVEGEVYVYGSFVQSKMHQRGVGCTDCHNPHSLDLVLEGNALCGQCHTPHAPLERFPTLQKKDYDSPEHHFHKEGSEGAKCVNCHMASRTFMQVDPRRDHSFRIPRPDLSVRLGTPNACNDCHTDQSAEWAADAVKEWYGTETTDEPHFAEAFTLARRGDPRALEGLVRIIADLNQPVIVRATAVEYLQPYGEHALSIFTGAAASDEPMIRLAALRAMESVPFGKRVNVTFPLLSDPVRAVRIEAARILAQLPSKAVIPEGGMPMLTDAIEEYRAALLYSADMPGPLLNLARLHEDQGDKKRAEEAYKQSLEIDPHFIQSACNLVHLLNSVGRNSEAELVLRRAIERAPGEGELYYSLGLLLAEVDRLDDAVEALGEAARLLRDDPRVQYNYGLALQNLERLNEAETALYHAYELDPSNPDHVNALAVLYRQQKNWDAAETFLKKLIELVPDAPGPPKRLEGLRREAAGLEPK